MDKPPFPIFCKCCNLPAFYVFEKHQFEIDVFCHTCAYIITEFNEQILNSTKYKSSYELNKNYNKLRKQISDDYQLLTHMLNPDGIYRDKLKKLLDK